MYDRIHMACVVLELVPSNKILAPFRGHFLLNVGIPLPATLKQSNSKIPIFFS